MPPEETDTSSPSTPLDTSVWVTTPVAGFSATSAPCLVTAMIAGGTAAAGLTVPDAWLAGVEAVTVTVGAADGVLPPHADNAAAIVTAPSRAAGNRVTRIWISIVVWHRD